MDGNTAALSVGLEDGLDIHGNLNRKTGDGVDLSTVVGNVGINGGIHVDGVAPSSIDLLDGSTDVKKERTVTIVRALAGIREVPLEVDVGHTESVLENPSERTEGHILEALKIHPINTLRNSTSPIILVINDRLTLLHDLPDLLANGDDLVDVNAAVVLIGTGSVRLLNSATSGASQLNSGGTKNIFANSKGYTS